MPKTMRKTDYPVLNERRVKALANKIVAYLAGTSESAKLDFVRCNKGKIALEIGIDNKIEEPEERIEGIDSLLGHMGLISRNSNEAIDFKYGKGNHHFTYVRNGIMWTLEADNGYASNFTRIYLEWVEKLDSKMKKAVIENVEPDEEQE